VCAFALPCIIPRNTHYDNQILLFGNILNRSGGMGIQSLLSVVFPLLITREIKTLVLHHLVCALRPGAACLHSCGRLRQHGAVGSCLTLCLSPEMWHSFSRREHNQNNQIQVLMLEIAGLAFYFFFLISSSLPPSLAPLACSGRSSHIPLLSIQQQPSRGAKVCGCGCSWVEREEWRWELLWQVGKR